jgi:hypothetical protein
MKIPNMVFHLAITHPFIAVFAPRHKTSIMPLLSSMLVILAAVKAQPVRYTRRIFLDFVCVDLGRVVESALAPAAFCAVVYTAR